LMLIAVSRRLLDLQNTGK